MAYGKNADGNSLWVAAGNYTPGGGSAASVGKLITSSDGKTWSVQQDSFKTNIYAVASDWTEED